MIDLTQTPTTALEQYTILAIKYAREEIANERRHRQGYRETRNFQFVRIARRNRLTAHIHRINWRSRILSELRDEKVWLGGTRRFNIPVLNH